MWRGEKAKRQERPLWQRWEWRLAGHRCHAPGLATTPTIHSFGKRQRSEKAKKRKSESESFLRPFGPDATRTHRPRAELSFRQTSAVWPCNEIGILPTCAFTEHSRTIAIQTFWTFREFHDLVLKEAFKKQIQSRQHQFANGKGYKVLRWELVLLRGSPGRQYQATFSRSEAKTFNTFQNSFEFGSKT